MDLSEREDGFDFVPLAERPDAVPQVARWWCEERGLPRRHESLEAYLCELASLKACDFPFHLLALGAGNVLGVATLKDRNDLHELFPDSRYWLSGVYVAPAHRGRGVATALCLKMVDIAKTKGAARLHLTTEALDGGLYAKLGWRPVRRIHVEGDGLLVMARDVP